VIVKKTIQRERWRERAFYMQYIIFIRINRSFRNKKLKKNKGKRDTQRVTEHNESGDLRTERPPQLYLLPSDRKRNKKTVHNEHKNTIDMLDYEAVTYICVAYKVNCKFNNALILQNSKSYSGDRASLYGKLLQDSYFMRNVLHISAIITLGNLKSNKYFW